MRKLCLLIFLSCIALSATAQKRGDVYDNSNGYVWPKEKAVAEKLKNWQDLKFGILMHWGLYAVPGIVESWSICAEDWIQRDTTQTYEQYKNWYWGLAKDFNPTAFNPDQWAAAAKDAGMKYMIFTTKHHDGFCMFDSKYTDFSIAHFAFKGNPKKDVAKYVFEAFRKQGFMTGAYFSKPDWHSQLYWWNVFPTHNRNVNYNISKYPWRWEQFKSFTRNQMEEVLSRYGNIDILWLDGGWVCKENGQDIDMDGIAKMARSHQPSLIIVDRTIRGPYENYQTPERAIPDEQRNYPWESCIPLSNDWGHVKNPVWKSPEKVINTLIEIVAKGGNMVLGVGPSPEGTFEAAVTERLHRIGLWMKRYGEAIYNTTTTKIYHDGDLFFTAAKDGKTLYALYTLKDGAKLPTSLSWHGNIPAKGSKLTLIGNSKPLKWQTSGDSVSVSLPKDLKDEPFALKIKVSD